MNFPRYDRYIDIVPSMQRLPRKKQKTRKLVSIIYFSLMISFTT